MKKISTRSNLLLAGLTLAATLFAHGGQAQVDADHLPLEITYVANEGFLIQSGDQKVLIDALFREGVAGYATVPPTWRDKLEIAQAPFDGVDLILVSHFHADHLDPQSVARHLENNPDAVLISSPQVTERVLAAFLDKPDVQRRIRTVAPQGSERIRQTVGRIGLEVMHVTHGARRASIQNLGQIVTLGGKKVLHIGDSEATAEDFRRLQLAKESIDVALLPFWYLTDLESATLVKKYIHPKHIIAMHIPPAEADKWTRRIRDVFPDATIAAVPMAKKSF